MSTTSVSETRTEAPAGPPEAAGAAVVQVAVSEVVVGQRPARLSEATEALLAAGVPAATRRAYAGDRADWHGFAALHGQAPYPVEPGLLAEYVGTLLSQGSPCVPQPRPLTAATVQRRLSAIATASVEAGHGRPDMRAAKLVLRGHRRVTPVAPRQAAPVTVPILQALVAQARSHRRADGSVSTRGLRDAALVLLSFAVAARRSEIVRLQLDDLNVRPEGLLASVLRAKTTDRLQPVAVPFAGDPDRCAVRAVGTYVERLAEHGILDGPLFRRVSKWDKPLSGGLGGYSASVALQRLAADAGVEVPEGFGGGWSSHSLRRGMATEARRRGADALAIARQGGWVDGSTVVATYCADVDRWEQHPLDGVL
jgi:integrase